MALPQWTVKTGFNLGTIDERINASIDLPIVQDPEITITKIAGELPPGIRIDGVSLVGVPFEVNRTTDFEFTLRASSTEGVLDRTFTLTVEGEDTPQWITPEGSLNIGKQKFKSFWLDTGNSSFGLYVTNGTSNFVNVDVDLYNGIPSSDEGSNGDYAFNLQTNQYYFKNLDRWVKLNDNVVKSVLGNDQQVEASLSVPNPNLVDFWLNLNSENNGLNLRLRQYDDDRQIWKPVEYTISNSSPLAPFDNQIWLQSFPNQAFFILKIYDASERQWIALDYDFGITPPDNTSKAFFVLDSSIVDFDLEAIDSDLAAGENLYYYIADGDGVLPDGLTLTPEGKITGIVEPILALDADTVPGYDLNLYDSVPLDFRVLDNDGFDSYLYDSQFYGFGTRTRTPKKLNRYFNFTVTVADDVGEIKRDFQIYVVGDDFLRADNTIMKSGTGLFTADVTYLRKPVWLTPGFLGNKRADNYQTFFLDVYDPNSLLGTITYVLRDINDDGTVSELPPGMSLDSTTGEVFGRIPYQPAVTREYRFTVEALRSESDLDIAEITANVYEDTLSGKRSIKLFKLPTGTQDNLDDLKSLVNQNINIENNLYEVVSVDDSNSEYDVINLDRELTPTYKAKSLNLIKNHAPGEQNLYVSYNSLENSRDREYWFPEDITSERTELIFSNSENYSIENIIPYVAWTITTTSPGGVIEFNFELADIDNVQDFEIAIRNYINEILLIETPYDSNDCVINIVTPELIYLELPQTAKTLNKNYISRPFNAEDSTGIEVYKGSNIVNETEFWKVFLDKPLLRTFTEDRQLALGIAKETVISQRINVAENEIISNIKTFTVNVLGNVESTIKWITPSDLLSIEANRVSYLKLEAETTLVGSNLKYDLVRGKIPNGLELKKNGEITGRVNQFSQNPVIYKGIYKNDRVYQVNDLVRVNNTYYKCIQDFPVDNFFNVDNEEYWQEYSIENTKGLTYLDRNFNLWKNSYTYQIGDIVGFADKNYKCVQDHTASVNNRPDTDSTQSFWILLESTTTFDNSTTIFDREFKFIVLARDNFGYSATTREFTLKVNDVDQRTYTNIYMKPFLKTEQRNLFLDLINDFNIFVPEYIYRPFDNNFGIQKELKSLVYAGIEQKEIDYFVATTTKNHKRKRFNFGEVKTAVAKLPGSNDIVYEVVYIDLVDPQEPSSGETKLKTKIKTNNTVKINQVKLETRDDNSLDSVVADSFKITGREGVSSVTVSNGGITITTRNNQNVNVGLNGVIEIFNRQSQVITVRSTSLISTVTNSVDRYRPKSQVITADSTALLASQNKDQFRYISNITNMRKRINNIGISERQFLPLWMRSSQNGEIQEINYVTAIPLCYCKPGTSEIIKQNIENFKSKNNFSFNQINYDIDRYIIEGTENNPNDQFVLFGNYRYNI